LARHLDDHGYLPDDQKSLNYTCRSDFSTEGLPLLDCGKHTSWKEYDPTEEPNPSIGYGTHVFVPYNGPSYKPKCMYPHCRLPCNLWCADEGCQQKELKICNIHNQYTHSRSGMFYCKAHRPFHYKSVKAD
jgi:hypothetical protein